MIATKDVSVVIGFKDWGLGRLALVISSLVDSFGELDGEVIVSDYGSADRGGAKQVAEQLGARYVYTETDGLWSRARALNAGFAVSNGRVLVATDADMVFSPRSMQIVGRWVLDDPAVGLLLQCRDLPEGWSDAEISAKGLDWDAFERHGRRRPRWGMGGMIAVSRATFLRLRGFDERMHTYGGEDIDFAWRVRRSGARLVWVEHPEVRMYHMWHESTAARHARSLAETRAVEDNKRIMREDKTFVRNITSWRHRPADAPPLVSVVISTYNRSGLLVEAIRSIQAQTVQDFEIVVVDDGSQDDTADVVAALQDPRIRYVRQDNAGVAAARNRGVDESRGQWVAVLDDDDLALPSRLEAQFAALTEGVNATFGSFANFDDETGDLVLHRTKSFTEEVTADKGGAPGHSTWLVDRDLMAKIRYDEDIPSGIDNNFALRSVRSGLRWEHSGRVHTLRRMHPRQITSTDAARQLATARSAYTYFTFTATSWQLDKLRKARGSVDYVRVDGSDDDSLVRFLPDSLVRRRLIVATSEPPLDGDAVVEPAGGAPFTVRASDDLRWEDLARFGGRVSLAGLSAEPRGSDREADPIDINQVLAVVRDRAEPQVPRPELARVELLVDGDSTNDPPPITGAAGTLIRRDGRVWTWWQAFAAPAGLCTSTLDELAARGDLTVHGEAQVVDAVVEKLMVEGEVAS